MNLLKLNKKIKSLKNEDITDTVDKIAFLIYMHQHASKLQDTPYTDDTLLALDKYFRLIAQYENKGYIKVTFQVLPIAERDDSHYKAKVTIDTATEVIYIY